LARKRTRFLLFAAIIAWLALLMWATWTFPTTRLAIRTTLYVPAVFYDLPGPLYFLADDFVREDVAFSFGDVTVQGRLYRPEGGGRHAALLIVPGAAPRGLDDPRIVRLSETIARLGYVVFIPELPDLMRGVVQPGEIEGIIEAFRFLKGHPRVQAESIGILGFSIGGGLALVAASDPELRDDVELVGSFGGHYSLKDVIVAAVSRTVRTPEGEEQWEPARHTLRVLERSLLDTLDTADRTAVRDALDGRLGAESLPADARRIFSLLTAEHPDEARALLDSAPPDLTARLASLSPEGHVSEIRARVFVLHSVEDPLVHSVESQKLVDALAAEGVPYHYRELRSFRHLNLALTLEPAATLNDGAQLLFATYRILLELR
jgi:acetyl esterase/lipase